MITQRNKAQLRQLARAELGPGEEVAAEVFGIGTSLEQVGGPPAIAVLTNARVLVAQKGAFKTKVASWRLSEITAVGSGKGLTSSLAFTVPGSQFELRRVESRASAEEFRRAVTAAIHPVDRPPESPSAPSAGASTAERLRELQELLDAGLISEDEFAQTRTEILHSI